MREEAAEALKSKGGSDASHEKEVEGEPPPFIAVFPQECMGQLQPFIDVLERPRSRLA